jgi:hypothetical protein
MSPLHLCWHNKMLLPANLSQSPLSQLAASRNISWGLIIRDCGDGELSPPLSPGCVPLDQQEKTPPGTNRQLDLKGRFILPVGWGEGLGCTMEPSKAQEPVGEGVPLIRLVRTRTRIQACLRRQKGRLITSQRLY